MIKWIADRLLWINFWWYVTLMLSFSIAGAYPRALYFLGAAILSLGIILM